MQNEFISRSKFVTSEIIREIERPDRDEVRLKYLRAELYKLATGKERPMKEIRLTYNEALGVLVAFMLVIGLVAYLCSALHQSRSNEREMSQKYYQVIRNGGPR